MSLSSCRGVGFRMFSANAKESLWSESISLAEIVGFTEDLCCPFGQNRRLRVIPARRQDRRAGKLAEERSNIIPLPGSLGFRLPGVRAASCVSALGPLAGKTIICFHLPTGATSATSALPPWRNVSESRETKPRLHPKDARNPREARIHCRSSRTQSQELAQPRYVPRTSRQSFRILNGPEASLGFNPIDALSHFGTACYMGALDIVMRVTSVPLIWQISR